MAFPADWPPRVASGVRSIRAYVAATATANYSDRAYLFHELPGANTFTPLPVVRPGQDVSAPDYPGPTHIPPHPAGTGQHGDDDPAMIWSNSIYIRNNGATPIFFSFDGTNDAGQIGPSGEITMEDRFEAGIAVRGAGNAFIVIAW